MKARAAVRAFQVFLALLIGLLCAGFVATCTAHGSTPRAVPLDRSALASMLRIAAPGMSDFSRVELAHYEFGAAHNFKRARVSYVGWSRPETQAEGMYRYAVIARAIARVADNPPSNWKRGWPKLGLARALVTIARHESAFWRPVHDGRLRGSAGEACLVQVHPAAARTLGIDLESLVGLDATATERCFRAGAEILARARLQCEDGSDPWFIRAIALYASGDDCDPARIAEVTLPRWKTWLLTADRKPLSPLAEIALKDGP